MKRSANHSQASRSTAPGAPGADRHSQPLRSAQGFTLIELLIVVTILAVLTAIAVPSYLSFRDRANKSVAGANVRAIVPSIESYFADNGTYTGMSVTRLQTSYDQAIRPTFYKLSGLTKTSYCISATVNGKTYKKTGPAVPIASSLTTC